MNGAVWVKNKINEASRPFVADAFVSEAFEDNSLRHASSQRQKFLQHFEGRLNRRASLRRLKTSLPLIEIEVLVAVIEHGVSVQSNRKRFELSRVAALRACDDDQIVTIRERRGHIDLSARP